MSGAHSVQTVPMRLFSWKGILGLGSGLALLFFWVLVVHRIVTDRDNHIGLSLLVIIPLALVAMLAGWLWRAAHRRRAGTFLLVLGLVTVVGVVLIDQLNILVEYEAWMDRGMPDRPF